MPSICGRRAAHGGHISPERLPNALDDAIGNWLLNGQSCVEQWINSHQYS
ncbi:MAG TPA: hypothetical protein VHC20_01555 [Candidatus Paceibacterota bacterium]|nr:hypothetical protein [Candidatus Paceibacterota bacterium]